MKVKKLILGNMETNGYVVSNDKNHCFIIDPGANGKKIVKYIEENEFVLDAILLTHGHFDYIGAVDYLYQKYPVDIYIHKEDINALTDAYINLSVFETPFIVTSPVKEAPISLTLCDYLITWMHLPGHSPGSSMIYLSQETIIFSGDVLFKKSIGRFDFPTSSRYDTKVSLEKIKQLDFDAIIYPGHGDRSTLQLEQMNNPYLKS